MSLHPNADQNFLVLNSVVIQIFQPRPTWRSRTATQVMFLTGNMCHSLMYLLPLSLRAPQSTNNTSMILAVVHFDSHTRHPAARNTH